MVHTKRLSFTKMNLWSKSYHEVETPNNCAMNSTCPPRPSVQPHNLLLKTLEPLGMPCLEPSIEKVIVGTNQLKSSHRHFIHDEWVSLQVCKRQIDNLLQQFRNTKDANINVCKSDYQTACTILDHVVSRDKSVSKLCARTFSSTVHWSSKHIEECSHSTFCLVARAILTQLSRKWLIDQMNKGIRMKNRLWYLSTTVL
jgi:hypothetical protein